MLALQRSTTAAGPLLMTASRRAYVHSTKAVKASIDASTKHSTSAKMAAQATASVQASSSAFARLAAFPKENPFTFQLIVATTKTSAADLMTQMVAEQKSLSEVDWKRNGIFVVFGFAYLGGFQWWLMVNKYRQWFPTMDRFAKLPFAEKLRDTAGLLDAGKMVLFDIFVHLPMMYFPTYYTVKEFIGGKSWNPADWAKDGVTKYVGNMKEDLTAMVQLWGPSDCIQFILPVHIRMPFRHLVSFFWTAYVSFTRGQIEEVVAVPEEH